MSDWPKAKTGTSGAPACSAILRAGGRAGRVVLVGVGVAEVEGVLTAWLREAYGCGTWHPAARHGKLVRRGSGGWAAVLVCCTLLHIAAIHHATWPRTAQAVTAQCSQREQGKPCEACCICSPHLTNPWRLRR